MEISVVGLTIMFGFLTVLLLSLNLRSNWHWLVKAGTILLAGYFWVVAFFSISAFVGLPSPDTMPEDFTFVWSTEREPIKRFPGAIYVWVITDGDKVPRAYKLPYTKDLHKKVFVAKGMICAGEVIRGKKLHIGNLRGTRGQMEQPYFEFAILPPVELPPKIPPVGQEMDPD